MAQAAGEFCLKQTDFNNRSRAGISEQREIFMKDLNQLDWMKTYPPSANYILCQTSEESTSGLFTYLLKEKFIIRECLNYEGLDSTFFRLAVKKEEQNKLLIQALKKYKTNVL